MGAVWLLLLSAHLICLPGWVSFCLPDRSFARGAWRPTAKSFALLPPSTTLPAAGINMWHDDLPPRTLVVLSGRDILAPTARLHQWLQEHERVRVRCFAACCGCKDTVCCRLCACWVCLKLPPPPKPHALNPPAGAACARHGTCWCPGQRPLAGRDCCGL